VPFRNGPIKRTTGISANLIYGGLSVYLMLGWIFAGLGMLIELESPGSYSISFREGQDIDQSMIRFLYFSFVTLTTTGYGDVLPLSAHARLLANLEAVIGQIFLAVTIARLVAAHTKP
jgi:hypothetical protein